MLPAAETVHQDGWLLRFTAGVSRNPNSVWPLSGGIDTLDSKIDSCERQYADRGLTCSFRLTNDDGQTDVEKALLGRGYVIHNPNTVLTNEIPESSGDPIDLVTLDGWLDTILAVDTDHSRDAIELKRGPLARIELPTWYGLVTQVGQPLSYGRAVMQYELYQLAELWTHPEHRNQGLGTHLIRGLLEIGKQMGAKTAFLPVSDSNAGARRLYERLGFSEVYKYRYLIPS